MKIVTGTEARARLARGAFAVIRPIATALGPHGRGVMFHRPPAAPALLYDGYAIAREVCPERGIEALGAQIVKETLFDIDRDVGDGTATAAVLIGALLRAGSQAISAGHDPGRLADELLRVGGGVARGLSATATGRGVEDWLEGVAVTAAREPDVAALIADCSRQVGAEGVIKVEEGPGVRIEHTVAPGMAIRMTPVSTALYDAPDHVATRLDKPFVLVADDDIDSFGKLAPVLEGFARSNKALLIVARNLRADALAALVRNKTELGLRVGAIRVSEVGERGYEMLEDVAIATGAQMLSERLGVTIEQLRPPMLGRADEATVEGKLTTIVRGQGATDAIERRKAELRQAIERQKYLSLDRELLQERLARFSGGVARIMIGAPGEAPRRALLARAKKAVAAVQAARRTGVLPGGGTALLRASTGLDGCTTNEPAERAARHVLRTALRAVPAQLIRNSGVEVVVPWLARIENEAAAQRGLDLARMEIVDLLRSAIVDPAQVVATALERAVSAAATLLRCEVAISR
jgi:chaperonin GroEL